MKKLLLAAVAVLGIGLTAGTATADGCGTPFCQGSRQWSGKFLHPYPAPVLQAAPWYLYFPYNAHFMTPGPLHAPFYAPPYHGGGMVNPYFAAPAHMHHGAAVEVRMRSMPAPTPIPAP